MTTALDGAEVITWSLVTLCHVTQSSRSLAWW